MKLLCVFCVFYNFRFIWIAAATISWEDWWSYDGFSGPDFWGLVNSDWKMCVKGHHQSPVNIDPKGLLFDPSLKQIKIDNSRVTGTLTNTGQFLCFSLANQKPPQTVLIEEGPMGFYRYSMQYVVLHFGLTDSQGSEHAVAGEKFPAEIQILGYNVDIYENFTEASRMPHGLVALSALVEIESFKKAENSELKRLVTAAIDVSYKGKQTVLQSFSIAGLLPKTSHYVTYEGSLTYPGCYESPLYISAKEMKILRDTQRSEEKLSYPVYLADNFRPLKPLNNRVLRTNINFKTKGSGCPTMYKEMYYRSNPWRRPQKADGALYK